MLGYDRPEATAKALQVHADGKTWLHTGDIGYMSEDGVLYTMTRGAPRALAAWRMSASWRPAP